jgi:hypothetical protein
VSTAGDKTSGDKTSTENDTRRGRGGGLEDVRGEDGKTGEEDVGAGSAGVVEEVVEKHVSAAAKRQEVVL